MGQALLRIPSRSACILVEAQTWPTDAGLANSWIRSFVHSRLAVALAPSAFRLASALSEASVQGLGDSIGSEAGGRKDEGERQEWWHRSCSTRQVQLPWPSS